MLVAKKEIQNVKDKISENRYYYRNEKCFCAVVRKRNITTSLTNKLDVFYLSLVDITN